MISCLLTMEQTAKIYDEWMPRFMAASHCRTFIETLEQFVLQKRVSWVRTGL